MQSCNVIAFDTHCASCDAAVFDVAGKVQRQVRCDTTIPALRAVIEAVKRPRHVVIEEGPLADWLVRELRPFADVVLACDPRRNAHIAKDGDKDDPIDAVKLGQLYRGGFVRPVHQAESLERAAFKQQIGIYHDRVRNVTRHANRIGAQFRRHGIFVRQSDLLVPGRSSPEPRAKDKRDLQEPPAKEKRSAQEPLAKEKRNSQEPLAWEKRKALLAKLPTKGLRTSVQVLLEEFDLAHERLTLLRKHLRREARAFEPIRRFVEVPGIKWIRAATFFAYVDTPWRFRTKQALWRYMGIGLERRHSGEGMTLVRVPASVEVCRPLKSMILGAAKSAIAGENPFADRHKEWRDAGVSPRNARRNVARSQAATLWGMWKQGGKYRSAWVGVAHGSASELKASKADG